MENEYFKDFDSWNENKKQIEIRINRPSPRLGEIWICDFGLNIGFEIDGKTNFKRPALVICSFMKNGALVLPLTSKIKKFTVKVNDQSFAKLTQIRFIDAKRFDRRVKMVSQDIVLGVIDKLINILKNNKNGNPYF